MYHNRLSLERMPFIIQLKLTIFYNHSMNIQLINIKLKYLKKFYSQKIIAYLNLIHSIHETHFTQYNYLTAHPI